MGLLSLGCYEARRSTEENTGTPDSSVSRSDGSDERPAGGDAPGGAGGGDGMRSEDGGGDGTVPVGASEGDAPLPVESDADIASVACDQLQDLWRAFVERSLDCEGHDDCVAVGGNGTCDCARSLGDDRGTAISRSALEQAHKYLDRFESPQCIEERSQATAGEQGYEPMSCDAGALEYVRCENNRCVGYGETLCMPVHETNRGWVQCDQRCMSTPKNQSCPDIDAAEGLQCDAQGLFCAHCSEFDFVEERIDAVCDDGMWRVQVSDCSSPPDPSMIAEEQIGVCSQDADCVIVPYQHCCGATKRAINQTYLEKYNQNPDWQVFDHPINCEMIGPVGACPSDTDVTTAECRDGYCRLVFP